MVIRIYAPTTDVEDTEEFYGQVQSEMQTKYTACGLKFDSYIFEMVRRKN